MPYNRPPTPRDETVQIQNSAGATPAGSKVTMNVPLRGMVTEVGFCPWAAVTSGMTLQVNWGNNINSQASNITTIVTSTTGTFTSTVQYEGAACSVQGLSTSVAEGDCLQFVTSGGDTSATGCTVWAVIRRN